MSIDIYVNEYNRGLDEALSYLERKEQLRKGELKYLEIIRPNEYSARTTDHKKEDMVVSLNFNPDHKPLILNGSGMLHHLTYTFLKNMHRNGSYSVLFLDKHDDGLFGGPNNKLFCGGFTSDIILDNQLVSKLLWLNYDDNELIEGFEQNGEVTTKRFVPKNQEDIYSLIHKILTEDVYISLDLDCLSEKCVSTYYSQGEMELSFLLELLNETAREHNIIGADICGLKSDGIFQNSLKTYSKIFNTLVKSLN